MQSYWLLTKKEDEDSFNKYLDRLNGKIPLYLQVTNGLVGGFEVSDPFKDTIHVGFLYLQRGDDDELIQNIYIFDDKDAGNMAIELMDTLYEQNLTNQIDVKYCIDEDPIKAVLVLAIGEYGLLQEDLYSAYFTNHTIRKYAYMKEDYYKRNFTEKELNGSRTVEPEKPKAWRNWFKNFAKRISSRWK